MDKEPVRMMRLMNFMHLLDRIDNQTTDEVKDWLRTNSFVIEDNSFYDSILADIGRHRNAGISWQLVPGYNGQLYVIL